MALLTAEFCVYDHHFPLSRQVANICTGCVSIECLVMWSTHTHEPKMPWCACPFKDKAYKPVHEVKALDTHGGFVQVANNHDRTARLMVQFIKVNPLSF